MSETSDEKFFSDLERALTTPDYPVVIVVPTYDLGANMLQLAGYHPRAHIKVDGHRKKFVIVSTNEAHSLDKLMGMYLHDDSIVVHDTAWEEKYIYEVMFKLKAVSRPQQ